MNYQTLKFILSQKDRYLLPYDAANGTSTDNTTDANITRDPNNYLSPRADWARQLLIYAALVVALLAVIILIPKAAQSFK